METYYPLVNRLIHCFSLVIGERGFPLPMLRKLKWEDTEVTTGQVTIELS